MYAFRYAVMIACQSADQFSGITSMSGHQIKYGLEFAKKPRAELPNCPSVGRGPLVVT